MSWIVPADVRGFLNKSSTAEDAEIQDFIDGACAAIENRIGHVDVTGDLTEFPKTGRNGVVILDETPVATIVSVDKLAGDGSTTSVPAADPVAGVDGWTLESVGGVLTLPSPWTTYKVVYTAGRNPVPANIVEAAKYLTGHLWRTTQLNAGGGRAQQGDTDQVIPGAAVALPYRVRQMLGLGDNLERDEVLIA